MGIYFIDGFDAPGTATQTGELGMKWLVSNSGTGLSFVTGRSGGAGRSPAGQALRWASAQATTRISRPLWKSGPDPSTASNEYEFTIGFGYRLGSIPASASYLFRILNEDGTIQSGLQVTSSGTLRWVRPGPIVLATTSGQISAATWHHIEVYWGANGASRDTVLRIAIDGSVENFDGTLNNGTANDIDFGPDQTDMGTVDYDDIVFLDPQDGIDPVGPMLGETTIDTLAATGDGNSTAWTGVGTGTADWERIDDPLGTDADGDSSYIESSTPGQESLFTFTSLAGDANDPYCVAVNTIARQVEPGGASFYTMIRQSGANDYMPYRNPVCDSYMLSQVILHKDNSGSDWTTTTVDAAEFGVSVEAE